MRRRNRNTHRATSGTGLDPRRLRLIELIGQRPSSGSISEADTALPPGPAADEAARLSADIESVDAADRGHVKRDRQR